ncbi:MAG: hypothetical protein DIAAKJNI_00210 [Candidatus Argoarchaeum ethanivorans]|uniref:Uncharacterized protein n=1 Tax=Candidatus Argoarchaeum ethanivorans TaxID=2608793 RepID=A0A811T8Q3_9EURY|nr:MAG: hypothetical protein DIAAKJNI_00210 [Candidatus Argoarchaeum ethanivorans]
MIEVQNLTKTFNGKTVLNGISFEVKEGEIKAYDTVEHLRKQFSKPVVEITFVDSEESNRRVQKITLRRG